MGSRILFVDDEGDWRFIPGLYLKDAGYEVLTAKNGTEALQISQAGQLDLVILDVNLGGENGVAVLKLLRQHQPSVPIMLYTGQEHDDASIQAMLAEGAHSYHRKGTMAELLTAVKNALHPGGNVSRGADFSV